MARDYHRSTHPGAGVAFLAFPANNLAPPIEINGKARKATPAPKFLADRWVIKVY
jgi:hypothetical protein